MTGLIDHTQKLYWIIFILFYPILYKTQGRLKEKKKHTQKRKNKTKAPKT